MTGTGNFLVKREILDIYPMLSDYQFEDILIGRKNLIEDPPVESIGSEQLTMINKLYLNRIPV